MVQIDSNNACKTSWDRGKIVKAVDKIQEVLCEVLNKHDILDFRIVWFNNNNIDAKVNWVLYTYKGKKYVFKGV